MKLQRHALQSRWSVEQRILFRPFSLRVSRKENLGDDVPGWEGIFIDAVGTAAVSDSY